MAAAHRGLGITEEDFGRVVEHLRASLAAFDVPEDDVAAVLDEVATLEPAVVEDRSD